MEKSLNETLAQNLLETNRSVKSAKSTRTKLSDNDCGGSSNMCGTAAGICSCESEREGGRERGREEGGDHTTHRGGRRGTPRPNRALPSCQRRPITVRLCRRG